MVKYTGKASQTKPTLMGAYLGEEETFVQADLTAASVTTVVEYNVFDVNKDNAVDIDDLIRILNNYTDLFQ